MRLHSIAACIGLALSSCNCETQREFSFGEDYDLTGEDFDVAKLADVAKRTGLAFPEGSEGEHFFNHDSGIDDSFAAKIIIPKARVDEFKQNEVFRIPGNFGLFNESPYQQIGRAKSWWELDSLEDPIHRVQNLPDAELLELSFGVIRGQHVAFISWLHSY